MQTCCRIAWDDNVFQANVNSVDDWAARIRPQLELNTNNGNPFDDTLRLCRRSLL